LRAQLDLSTLVPTESTRATRDVERRRDVIVARSEMADALVRCVYCAVSDAHAYTQVRILDLWQQSVLLMDEVDVLLHPLRSELNFPIGHKQVLCACVGVTW
jgi:hypothetical protein